MSDYTKKQKITRIEAKLLERKLQLNEFYNSSCEFNVPRFFDFVEDPLFSR
jgi:hypothetical protein